MTLCCRYNVGPKYGATKCETFVSELLTLDNINKSIINNVITITSQWASWRRKSPATRRFIELCALVNIK